MQLDIFNPHWKHSFTYQISFRRKYYDLLIASLEQKYITNLLGLRRVGKTTLMRQMIDYLIEEMHVDRTHILFISFDDLVSLEERIDEYQKITQHDISREKIYIFCDEIQKLSDWQSKIKIYYDLYPQLKFIVSGSSSLFLQKKESLAGRIYDYHIQPLSFYEYLSYTQQSYFLENPGVYQSELLGAFERYLLRGFIDIIDASREEALRYTHDLSQKIIREDITSFFRIEHPELLTRLFRIISQKPGMLLDYKNFSNDLDIDQRTLERYIYFLEEAFLIKRIYNYSPNLIKSERKLKKVYLSTPSFCSHADITGEIFENYVVTTLDLAYFYRVGSVEVDGVGVDRDGKITMIECKYSPTLKKDDYKGLLHTYHKFAPNKSILITKNNHESLFSQIQALPSYLVEGFLGE